MRLIKLISLVCVLMTILVSCKISNSNEKKESVSYSIPTIETTALSHQILDNNKVRLATISFYIPTDFKLKNKSSDLLFENDNGLIQFNIEDKTKNISDIDNYIQKTVFSLKQKGLNPGEVESIIIGEYEAKRFIFSAFDITNSDITYFCYFLEIGNSKVVVNLISKNKAVVDTAQADELVTGIKFIDWY